MADFGLSKAVMDELREGRLAQLFAATKVQRRAAQVNGRRRMMKHGEVKFQIHPKFFHYWGQRLGYECWEDPQFVHEFLRDNPECRVQNESTKIMSGWKPPENKLRFRKSYA